MQSNVRIICSDNQIDQNLLDNIVEQVAHNINESEILQNSDSCDFVKILVNVRVDDYPTAQELNSKIFWAFDRKEFHLSSDKIRNFLLRCLHLELGAHINNLLIIFSSKTDIESKTIINSVDDKQNKAQDDGQDEESLKSFIAIEPKYKLHKVIMSSETKRQVERAIALIRNREKIFDDWGFSEIDPHTKAILCFYGSPGTGKTMCAHALASELGKKILIASYASIESKWVGEGPKNLQKIFHDAATQDAILFFDEADSFLSKRVNNAETGSDKHYNRMSNEMFQLLEDYNGTIIFATNLVSDFDKAFKSRILAFIEFEKPDFEARKELIRIMIPSRLPMKMELSCSNLDDLATISEGFSGREIRKAMLTTLSEGAMNNVTSFSIEHFLTGFNSVKEETLAIEETISNTSISDSIEDYLQYNTENQAIIGVCLKALWQSEELNNLAKWHLTRICKVLNMDYPDLSISYKNKNINEEIGVINRANRIRECAMYCCELFAYQAVQGDSLQHIDSILTEMGVNNIEEYHNYINAIIKIK